MSASDYRSPLPVFDAGPQRQSAVDLLDAVVGRVVPSVQPAVAFSSLAEACVPLLGPRCIIDIAEGDAVAYRISRPERVSPPGDSLLATIAQLEASGETLLLTDTAVAVAVRDDGRLGLSYQGVVTCCWPPGGPATPTQAHVFAHLVAHTVELVHRERIQAALESEQLKSANLQRALDSNRQIGMAMGILMAASGLSTAAAFEVLRTVSQHTHRKLRDVAAAVVATGSLPQTVTAAADRR